MLYYMSLFYHIYHNALFPDFASQAAMQHYLLRIGNMLTHCLGHFFLIAFWTFSRNDKLRRCNGDDAVHLHEKNPLCDAIGIPSRSQLKIRNISLIFSMFHQFQEFIFLIYLYLHNNEQYLMLLVCVTISFTY